MTIDALPNIPCQDCPSGSSDVVWRYNSNPIIPRDLIPSSNSIFNSAVVPYNEKFAGVFRCDNKKREKNLNRGVGDDGVRWKPDIDPFCWECDDPGINWFQDRYSVTWCNGYHGHTTE